MPTHDLDLPTWTATGHRLGAIGRCSQWWLGDWIRYGNARFGERYSRASKITGYDTQTLMNMVYVASRFPFSRRRETLSWSHHEAVASLEADDQERWLTLAEEKRLSVSDLRVELRTARRAANSAPDNADMDDSSDASHDEAFTCPHCGREISLTQKGARDLHPAALTRVIEIPEPDTAAAVA
jgi:hypothetical protein